MRRSHLATLRTSPAAQRARELRSRMTDAERRLWHHVRGSRLQGFTFRRQVPLGSYIVDFVCERQRLIVELDGGQHADRLEHDKARTQWLSAQGYSVVRLWNNDVLANIEGVLEVIRQRLETGYR